MLLIRHRFQDFQNLVLMCFPHSQGHGDNLPALQRPAQHGGRDLWSWPACLDVQNLFALRCSINILIAIKCSQPDVVTSKTCQCSNAFKLPSLKYLEVTLPTRFQQSSSPRLLLVLNAVKSGTTKLYLSFTDVKPEQMHTVNDVVNLRLAQRWKCSVTWPRLLDPQNSCDDFNRDRKKTSKHQMFFHHTGYGLMMLHVHVI